VLRERSTEITEVDGEVRAFVQDLVDTMHANRGVGLAANQVGVARRVCVVEAVEGELHVLVNPVLVEAEGTVREEEGCLSIPDIYAEVQRSARVVVEALDGEGARRRIEATGLLARAIQHELDHLDGILFLDRVGPIKRRFLMRQWERSRRGKTGYIQALEPEAAPSA
jgi:peptide deformylase